MITSNYQPRFQLPGNCQTMLLWYLCHACQPLAMHLCTSPDCAWMIVAGWGVNHHSHLSKPVLPFT